MVSQSLRSDNVTLSYGTASDVGDLSVDIRDGEITTIIGPNACGKGIRVGHCGQRDF